LLWVITYTCCVPPTKVVPTPQGTFEWDAHKADENRREHRGVSFEEAWTALAHPSAAVFDDGSGEGILKAVGMSRRGRLLTVVHQPRGERVRIISAWRSTPEEQRLFMTGGV
jgi:uncharacterized protein